MRTKAAALQTFWASFGLRAYAENKVPTNPEKRADFFQKAGSEFPYITYQIVTGAGNETVSMSASIWDRDREGYSGNKANNAKAEEISAHIGLGGINVLYTGGCVRIQRGSPFAQSMSDPADDAICRKLLNVTATYISEN